MAGLIEQIGQMDMERRRRGRPTGDAYATLVRAIVGQQLSVKAAVHDPRPRAGAVRRRPPDAAAAARRRRRRPARLRALGPQGRTTSATSRATSLDGSLEIDRLDQLPKTRGGRGDHRGARPRRVERPRVPDVPSGAPRRASDRRPRDSQGRPGRVRPGGDAQARRAGARSPSPGAHTAPSPASICGNRWRTPPPRSRALPVPWSGDVDAGARPRNRGSRCATTA